MYAQEAQAQTQTETRRCFRTEIYIRLTENPCPSLVFQ